MIDIVEIIAEFKADVPGIEGGVKCRIEKSIIEGDTNPYSFLLSHYYAGTDKSGVYYPENTYETYETTKLMLFAYLKAFTTSFEVEANPDY